MTLRIPPRILAGLLTAAMVNGCVVGPDFHSPAAPETRTYTAMPVASTVAIPGVTGGTAQSFTEGEEISAEWWALFQSPSLNALVERTLAMNHDIKAARAAL